MKMPGKIEEIMFAPCGINCVVCYKHCYTKNPCEGCFNSGNGKIEHCRKCKIKVCTKSKCVKYCFDCNEFPCKIIKNLEKSYNIRYNVSLIDNSIVVKQEGLDAFMKRQQHDYKCNCGGIISLHDAECSECNKKNLPCKRKELSEMTLEEMWQLFPIMLEAPSEKWDAWYKEEESILKKLIKDKSVRINHIGSTAVKGIWAKPTIDILLEAKEEDFENIANILDTNGWGCMSHVASRISYQKGYTKYGFSEKVYHLHLRKWGDCDELYFRDYLNANEKVAKEYEELKLKLWKKFEHDRDAYTSAKGDFISQQTDIAKRLYKGRY